mmetsp:Transcript_5581/g.22033  ORF Transcript_5581/g.22033 Transcript_5581/m.22033 type:complete len:252 (-) Transcript_5581:1613-2368(-)
MSPRRSAAARWRVRSSVLSAIAPSSRSSSAPSMSASASFASLQKRSNPRSPTSARAWRALPPRLKPSASAPTACRMTSTSFRRAARPPRPLQSRRWPRCALRWPTHLRQPRRVCPSRSLPRLWSSPARRRRSWLPPSRQSARRPPASRPKRSRSSRSPSRRPHLRLLSPQPRRRRRRSKPCVRSSARNTRRLRWSSPWTCALSTRLLWSRCAASSRLRPPSSLRRSSRAPLPNTPRQSPPSRPSTRPPCRS